MMRAFLTAYPWDLLDDDTEAVLDRLHGELGIGGLSVWGACPPVVQWRARGLSPRMFRTKGGLLFQPTDACYGATRIKPTPADWVKAKHPLQRITEAAAVRGLDIRVIVSAALTGRVAERHPEMACKNLFGALSHEAVCLSNPDVQSYLCGLVSDLSGNYNIDAVVVADFFTVWTEAFGEDLKAPVPLGGWDRLLLSLCFCESCRQRAAGADVDIDAASRAAGEILERSITPGAEEEGEPSIGASVADPIAALLRWRGDELSSLLARLADICTCDLVLQRSLSEPEGRQQQDLDVGPVSAVSTLVEKAEDLPVGLLPGAARHELDLDLLQGRGAPELVSTVSHAAELGYSVVHLGNYGLLPEAAMAPIKQAIRFARRSAPETA